MAMRIISVTNLIRRAAELPTAMPRVANGVELAERATWTNVQDVRATFGAADPVRVASGRTVYVFNVGGGAFRLIASIHWAERGNPGRIYFRELLTHREYNKNLWKERN